MSSREGGPFMDGSPQEPAGAKPDLTHDLILAEYNHLNDELLRRLDTRYQMIQFALTAFGALLTVGFSVQKAIIIYTYPALVLAVSLMYVTNTAELHKIRIYIGKYIEPRVPTGANKEPFGWINYRAPKRQLPQLLRRFGTVGNIGAKLILLTSAVIAIVVGNVAAQAYREDSDTLFLIACIVTVLIGVVLFVVETWFPSFQEEDRPHP